MRLSLIATTLLAGLSLVGPAASEAGQSPRYTTNGLSVTLPGGWEVVHRRLTPCTNPIERLTVAGHDALVMLQESLDPRRYVSRFDPRPTRFALRGNPRPLSCCAPPGEGAGWFFNFRDRGRAFYVFVYLGEPGTRAEALSVLDSLIVLPRAR